MKFSYIFIYILILSSIYYLLDNYSSEHIFHILNSNNRNITFWEAIYFTIITQSTIGFGDIVPKSFIARLLVTFQSLGTILLLIYISKK